MANIKVHLLNFHSIFTHIEIVLEDQSTTPSSYYGINRWEEPQSKWETTGSAKFTNAIEMASSKYSFDLDAEPAKIVQEWNTYWRKTKKDEGILGNNCAVAAQWFLTRFAKIPEPSLSNVSANLLVAPLFWPSFIPCPVTLPGRVMSNAKFYLEARNHPGIVNQYSRVFLYTSLAVMALAFAASVFMLAVASSVLTGGLATLAITGCVFTALGSSYGFFNAVNTLSAKNIADTLKKTDEPQPQKLEEAPHTTTLNPATGLS